MGQREDLLRAFNSDRIYAHEILFAHRHKDVTPEIHHQILRAFYGPHPKIALQAFRGAAKSTLLEEHVILKALFREFSFSIFVGNSYDMACERLTAVKEELTNNDMLIELFGDQHGPVWSVGEIVLSNGIKIQSIGARQAMRGVKHNDHRPDYAAIDDLEDEEMVATKEAIIKNKRWFNGTMRPAMSPDGKIRMLGTPLHPDALIEQLMTRPDWLSLRFPIMYLDKDGKEQSSWAARFSTEWIQNLRAEYVADGALTEFDQEYMCRAENAELKTFKPEMIKILPAKTTWSAKKLLVDPARTVKEKTSAQTGYVVQSWIGNKLVVHEAIGRFHKPDEIVDQIFKFDEEYKPVEIAVEVDGLEEFLMQPLRNEMLKRGIVLPLVGVRAPRDKIRFITGLQPFYNAQEVIHAKHLPELDAQLLAFPKGRMDILNAEAYSLKQRTGLPVYEDFSDAHVSEAVERLPKSQHFLCVSARAVVTAGALLQYSEYGIRVLCDWVEPGPPVECLRKIVDEATILAGKKVEMVAPLEQFEKYSNHGLPGAARQNRYELKPGASTVTTIGNLKPWLQRMIRGEPAFQVDMDARWVLNGLAGGYGRKLDAKGKVEELPTDNQYRIVMEAIESFAGWIGVLSEAGDNDPGKRYATTKDGTRFLTTLPDRQQHGRRS